MNLSVWSARVSLAEPFRTGWAGLRPQPAILAPQQLFGALGAPTIVQRAQGTKAGEVRG